jgi:hypothetical protein
MGLSKMSKLKDILKNPDAMAIMEEYVPGLSKEPKLKMGAGMNLVTLAGLAPDKLKKEWLDDIDAKLKALGD